MSQTFWTPKTTSKNVQNLMRFSTDNALKMPENNSPDDFGTFERQIFFGTFERQKFFLAPPSDLKFGTFEFIKIVLFFGRFFDSFFPPKTQNFVDDIGS